MTFGVATDEKLRIKIKGDVQQNLFAVGSVFRRLQYNTRGLRCRCLYAYGIICSG